MGHFLLLSQYFQGNGCCLLFFRFDLGTSLQGSEHQNFIYRYPVFLGGTKCTKASDFPPVGNVSSLFFYPPSPAYSRPKTMALNTLLLFTTHLLVLALISSHSPLPTKYSHFSDTLSSSNLRHNLHVFHPRSPVFLLVSVGDLFLNFTTHLVFLQPHLKIREPFKEPPLLPVFQI